MRGFGYRNNSESSALSMSGSERNEGVTIDVHFAPKAKHQTVLKKFCSVSFFDDHLHLMRDNMATGKQTFQLVFILSQNKVEENLMVSSNI